MAVDVGSAVGYLDLDISGFLAGLQSAQSAADKESKNIALTVGGNISNFGKGLTSAGTTLTKNVTVPLAGIGLAGLKVATDFDKGMSEVKAISGATGKDFDALKEKAIELGADTAFSANEVAAAMTEMAKAGWSSEQIIAGMGGVLASAAASGEGLASVSTIVADAITGFGLEAADSTKIADLLTQAANSGTIGIHELGESFKYIAPVAGAMGLSVEDVTTALSVMSMAGIKGSQAGTSLKNILTNLVNPVGQSANAIAALGIEATNSDGSMKSLDEIVANLRTSFDGLTESEKAQYAAMLAGKEGMPGLLALLNLTEEEYNAVAASMDNAAGVAENTAAVMQDNLGSKVEQLGGSLESLAIKFAESVIPHLEKLVEWATGAVDKFTALGPETQQSILKFAGIAAIAGPVITVFGKITSGVGGVISAFGKIPGAITSVKTGFTTLSTGIKNVGEGFNLAKAGFSGLATQAGGFGTKMGAAMAGISAPVLAVVAAVAVLAAAFATLWKNNEDFRNKMTEIWGQITATFEKLTSGIVDRLNQLGFNFSSIGEVIRAAWEGLCNMFAPIFEGAFQQIATIFDTVVNVVLGILDVFISAFQGDWAGAFDGIVGIFQSVWDGVIATLQNVGNTLLGVLNSICGLFGTTWSSVWNSISSTFSNIWNGISSFATNVFTGISSTISGAISAIASTVSNGFNAVKTAITSVSNAIKTTVTNIWNSIKSAISTALNAVKTTITNVFNSAKTAITNTMNSVKTSVTGVWNTIGSAVSNAMSTAKNVVTSAMTTVKSAFQNGFNGAKSAFLGVFDGVQNKASSAMEAVKNAVSNAVSKLKGMFNFSWSLPKIKLPHISISGEFSLNPPSVPSISIEWYKKAMGNGMILDSATIFGFNSKTGKFLAGGEAGSETIVGTKNLMNMIKNAVANAVGPLVQVSRELAKASADLGYVTYNGFTKLKEVREAEKKTGRGENGDGDTFVFYSPKAIDEIEAAKQMKKTKRELAEGF